MRAVALPPSPLCSFVTSSPSVRPFRWTQPSLCPVAWGRPWCPAGVPQRYATPCKLLWHTSPVPVERISAVRLRETVRMAAVAQPVEVLVKAANGQPDQLGDCPFSQRVLLTLEEKAIPYDVKLVDTENKPAWFLEANPEGKVPVIKHEGSWVADSDVITKLLDEKYPENSLAVSEEKLSVGSKLFGSFVKFLKSKDPSDGSEEALLEELRALNEYLKLNGPFVGGEKISSVDLSLAPKLYHLKIALGHYKQWSIPGDLTYLLKYIEDLHNRQSFEKTAAPAPVVVKGWSKHLG